MGGGCTLALPSACPRAMVSLAGSHAVAAPGLASRVTSQAGFMPRPGRVGSASSRPPGIRNGFAVRREGNREETGD